MFESAEKWQAGLQWRPGPTRLMLEAGVELAVLCSIGAAIAALGLLPLGWRGTIVAGVCYALVTALVAAGLSRHAPHRHFGVANSITLSRAAFGVLLLAIAAEEALGTGQVLDTASRWGLTVAATIALTLDGLDGWVARRSNMTSEFGARFDMETDGLLMMGLALNLAVAGIVGPWVLASALLYHFFRIAGRIWPVLTAPLIPSMRRKVICVAQTAFLIVPIAPIVPAWGAQLSCLTGLVLLVYSFSVDIAWLTRRERSRTAAFGDFASMR